MLRWTGWLTPIDAWPMNSLPAYSAASVTSMPG